MTLQTLLHRSYTAEHPLQHNMFSCLQAPKPKDGKSKGGPAPQLQLLHNITGSFRPGVLTALMGVSGANSLTHSCIRWMLDFQSSTIMLLETGCLSFEAAFIGSGIITFVQSTLGPACRLQLSACSPCRELMSVSSAAHCWSVPMIPPSVCLLAGAGKTTLMDVLAGRKTTGRVEGQVWVDGHPKEQHTFARVCGYVEQTDIHSARVRARLQLVHLL
jgi:hypothetical protein